MTIRNVTTLRAPTGDAKIERQSGEIGDLRQAVEALSKAVADRREPVRSVGGF